MQVCRSATAMVVIETLEEARRRWWPEQTSNWIKPVGKACAH
jgi:hypothetical protein